MNPPGKITVLLRIFPFLLWHTFPVFLMVNQAFGDSLPDTAKSNFVIVGNVFFEGNKITRQDIIRRELSFHKNDTIPLTSLASILENSRDNVFNTSLFNFVTIDTVMSAGNPERINITVHVTERWYIWPWPYFRISDRNLNAWMQTTDLDLVTYGADITLFNLFGENVTLVFPVHLGFNQKYGMNLTTPYFNRKKTVGFGFGMSYERNHEVVIKTNDNKPVYFANHRDFPKQLIDAFLTGYFRPNLYTIHTFRIDWQDVYFSDSLIKSPGFSINPQTNHLSYFSLGYQFKIDHRNVHFYPLEGYYYDLSVIQNGIFGDKVHILSLKSSFRKYWRISQRWYFASGLLAKISFPADQPYFLQQGLGYGREFLRGYEYYVIDGQHYLTLKTNVKYVLLPQRVARLGFLKSNKFNTLPYAFYLNAYVDLGYVYNNDKIAVKNNSLANHMLTGYGLGIDFTTYYDIVIRTEFSMNLMGEPGIYFHFIAPI
ncbi:MAG: hypothetical protein NTX61_11840 [Bacteroidetes bacterium]|nr:hypothetical protein [Bacteroidota bacterium]